MYEVLTIIKILIQVLQPQIHKGINATMYYYFPSPGINETMYFSNKRMCYLESIAELMKVSSCTKHQTAQTYP